MDKRAVIEYSAKMIKIANNGYLALKNGNLVDKRDYQNNNEVELFTKQGLYEVVDGLVEDILKANNESYGTI